MALACPECESTMSLPAEMRLSELVECSECRVELEVVTLEPVLLALAPEIEEDWGE